MATPEPQLDRAQQRQYARFQRMSLPVRAMPGGRCLLVSLPLGPAPRESIRGPLEVRRVLFSTVGPTRIKCLRPRPLFGLPLLDIRRCADAAAIEAAIRDAWRARTRELRETGRVLMSLGLDVGSIEGGSVLAIPLAGESPEARVLMHRLGEAILPSFGPLGGMPLASMGDRMLEVSESLDSGADVDCQIGSRVQELKQRGRVIRVRARDRAPSAGDRRRTSGGAIRTHPAAPYRPKVLLVGATVARDDTLCQALARQGYRAVAARGESEALDRLGEMSPDLVLSQFGLGRSDGATLVQAMRSLPGIERIPVVLLDELPQATRREAARAVGAAGYLRTPPDAGAFVARLRALIDRPGDRRYTRYAQRLVALLEGTDAPLLATQVGRGGIFIATEESVDPHSAMAGELKLPEVGRALRFAGEVLYRSEMQGARLRGLGLRFDEISSDDESALIEYLAWLESRS